MKKHIALALALAICLTLVCSVALADKVTVNFFHRWPNEPKFSYLNKLIEEFEAANPDIDIVADCVLNDSYKEKIRVLVSTDDLPDVFFSWSGAFGEKRQAVRRAVVDGRQGLLLQRGRVQRAGP